MKKFLLCLGTVMLAMAMLAMGAFAAETVIYENDFSDPSTLNDFEQYRMEWEIKDGGLYLTENFIDGTEGTSVDTSFAHLIYQTDEVLDDYIIEVDYMNIQTAGGIIFRADQDSVTAQQDGFFGYVAFIANNANAGALGCSGDDGKWKGNIKVGATGSCNISNNIHIKVTVKGEKIHTLITNIDNGKTVLDYTYTIGSSESDQVWVEGTFGLRMRAGMKANNAYSAGTAYFDNLKVTTANEATLSGGTPAPSTNAKPTTTIDTSSLVPVYTNNFDTAADIADFTQYRGTWAVYQGKLYLSAATGTQSYILYGGDADLVGLDDYVLDVDMYNVQTQGGVLVRSDYANVTGDTDDGIMGYMMFVSNTGTQGAIGAGQADGKWFAGNIEVSGAVMQPGTDIHIQAAVKGNLVQITITELASGKLLWQWCESNTLWSRGTFGFRLRGAATSAGLSNLNNTAFDNLVISTYGEPVEKTVVKMTIGQNVGYINDEAKTLDASPIIRESRTMLPVRFVAEAFGAEIGWDGATSTATVKTADTEIKITIGSNTAIVNGQTVTLDAPAFIENSRTYMPVRFVAENLGATVEWDGVTSTATLTK